MVADYEPWWQFEGWEEQIEQRMSYTTENEANEALQALIMKFKAMYDHEQTKEQYNVFWSDDEIVYCEACEDDAQIYHGLFIIKD